MSNDVHAVRFLRRATVGSATYNAGDVAGFAREAHDAIVKVGAGVSYPLTETKPAEKTPKA